MNHIFCFLQNVHEGLNQMRNLFKKCTPGGNGFDEHLVTKPFGVIGTIVIPFAAVDQPW